MRKKGCEQEEGRGTSRGAEIAGDRRTQRGRGGVESEGCEGKGEGDGDGEAGTDLVW